MLIVRKGGSVRIALGPASNGLLLSIALGQAGLEEACRERRDAALLNIVPLQHPVNTIRNICAESTSCDLSTEHVCAKCGISNKCRTGRPVDGQVQMTGDCLGAPAPALVCNCSTLTVKVDQDT
ncbi:hypothetical protein IE81DRAFT_84449 [Ceraceosorus guamensis]|uniref:Uncharacterized protein n=1 Tax=Ceraceosorus guamensis TaxID=1522189 RepID=A0A316W8B4_9BASI|nr:hypothetical protein IE81DRAFT_84449 [Ceraceosorus guamensis]PWN46137.1 hypothetical protein IE81DRAFT_84449 [Ceraceosorus guamensis]